MERKKEKILMQSLRRKQQQEEARQRKEQEALQRKEEERAKEEEKQRKKEDEKARRQIIFEQYKIKKAMEEAEKEVWHLLEFQNLNLKHLIINLYCIKFYRVVHTRCRIKWDPNPVLKCVPKITTALPLGRVPRPYTWNLHRRNLLTIIVPCPLCPPCPVKASVALATISQVWKEFLYCFDIL